MRRLSAFLALTAVATLTVATTSPATDLKLTIEGHTDNVGDAKANHDLSHRRAKAVTQYLVDKHGIDASRLQSTGFGDKKPTAKNDTPEGRQQNRRVELVKM
jgi:OOP family OmpA-OmpF porin